MAAIKFLLLFLFKYAKVLICLFFYCMYVYAIYETMMNFYFIIKLIQIFFFFSFLVNNFCVSLPRRHLFIFLLLYIFIFFFADIIQQCNRVVSFGKSIKFGKEKESEEISYFFFLYNYCSAHTHFTMKFESNLNSKKFNSLFIYLVYVCYVWRIKWI